MHLVIDKLNIFCYYLDKFSSVLFFGSWPTIPQLYVSGEFVGGSDIMIELYNSGELAEMIELANAN